MAIARSRSGYNKIWRDAHPEYRQRQLSHRRKHAMAVYGLTIEAYDDLYRLQNGTCRICSVDRSALKKRLAVDHDHLTGKVRGLLCDRCNRGIGFFSENPEQLRKAADYLEDKSWK